MINIYNKHSLISQLFNQSYDSSEMVNIDDLNVINALLSKTNYHDILQRIIKKRFDSYMPIEFEPQYLESGNMDELINGNYFIHGAIEIVEPENDEYYKAFMIVKNNEIYDFYANSMEDDNEIIFIEKGTFMYNT